jgi:DegV family protein with EDD domain
VNKVAITTNSACIFAEKAREHGITLIPFHIIIDGKDYRDPEVDIEDFYARLDKKENLPTTSPFSVVECLQTWQELSQSAETILHISMTSAFTAAYKVALQAKEMAGEKLPETTIEVIDSHTVGGGLALVTLEAAEMAAQGKGIGEIAEFVNHLIPQIHYLSTRDTLLYLDKGGRVFEAKSWAEAEKKASFRAIIEIDDHSGGITKPVARAKTKRQIMNKMLEITKDRVGNSKLHVFIGHTRSPEQAEGFRKMVESRFGCDRIYVYEASATIGFFNGRNLLELAFYGVPD